MTYSIVGRDPNTGQMGVAAQSQAFAVGASVTWALPGYGVIATQSMGEPMYGELGLDVLRGGLTAAEALTALRSVDPYPERRQVAMVDTNGDIEVYTGSACVEEAGHCIGNDCAALANMVVAPEVWTSMVTAFETTRGPLAFRLMAALRAAEDAGGDFRGKRSAALVVVRDERTGRPWRDRVVDLRVDDDGDPVRRLEELVQHNAHYHTMVAAFEAALGGDLTGAVERMAELPLESPKVEPDLVMWRAIVLALADYEEDAAQLLRDLDATAPVFVEAVRRFVPAGLLPDADVLRRILARAGLDATGVEAEG